MTTSDAETAPGADRSDPPAPDGHPGLDAVRESLRDAEWDTGSLLDKRAAMDQLTAGVVAPPGTTATAATLGGRPAEWLVPDGVSRERAVLYLHGGGYTMGSLASHRDLAGRLALASGVAVVTLDYRLAPEHPHPAALEDAVAAYRELRASGFDAERLVLAGDSAGGGLVFTTALALTAAEEELPAALVALSPWADLTQSSATFEAMRDRDPSVTKSGLDEMAEAYLAGIDPRTPLVSPVCAPRSDLTGFPPTCIEVGGDEVLLDDASTMADNLRDAGVEVTLTVWPQMIHVFQAFPPDLLPEARQSVDAVGAFVHERLSGGSSAAAGA